MAAEHAAEVMSAHADVTAAPAACAALGAELEVPAGHHERKPLFCAMV
jgi:hypothetical protein